MSTIVRTNAGSRIERDLDSALSRLHQLGGAVTERPGTVGGSSPFADEVDQVQVTVSGDVGLATRELLLERVNRLSAALERLHAGEYGICVECAEPIAPARLAAVPEVQTCVGCQAALERLGRRFDRSRQSVFAVGDDETASETPQGSYRSLFPNEEDRDVAR